MPPPALVAASVAHLVAVKMFDSIHTVCRALAVFRKSPVISVMRIEAIIDMTIKAMGPMEPRTCAEEQATVKPFGPVIAVRCACVRRVIEIAVGTNRRRSDLHTDLRGRMRWKQSCAQNSRCTQK